VETPEQWPRIKEIVAEAIEREPHVRSAYLDEACAENVTLRLEVESLLAAFDEAGGLFDVDAAEASTLPGNVGPYRLIRELGIGGMGQVWLAEQIEPVRRLIALKLIRAGMYDAAVMHRFQSERQSLAIMDHPAIAKVFDAGTTPTGQPYFAMEYVAGLPITDYCDQKRLGIGDRLTLFFQVCEGVQHAHQKAIIHRDLKPSNILVVEVDGKPRPRIIDFGLAKAIAPSEPGHTMFTHQGAFLGTPGYMSPEQADPEVQDIDTRADVYSLGVLLYELLTGFLPFDTTDWKKHKLDEMLRQLRESNPRRPSSKVNANRTTSSARAAARGVDSRHLVKLLRGDLDWIVLKALEKDRERRYGTAFELAADIERHLENRPVVARPASTVYRLRKYLRRNRASVAVLMGMFAVLIAFVITQTMQLRRITRERDRADRIAGFMTNMFKVSDPSEARGNSITAREILDRAAKDVDPGLTRDPELQAQMMYEMGSVFKNLGLYERARMLLTQSLEIRRRVLGPNNADTLKSLNTLAKTMYLQGRNAEAEKLFREALEIRRKTLGAEHPDTLQSQSDLAEDLSVQGRYTDAAKLRQETYESRRRVLGPEHPSTLDSMGNLAISFEDLGRNADAEKLWRETLAARRRVLGPEHQVTLDTMNNLALALEREDRYADAEKMERETIEGRRRILGPEHPDTLDSMSNLARFLGRQGRYADCEKQLREVLGVQRRVNGSEHPDTLDTLSDLAATISAEGRYAEAEKLERELLEIRGRVLGTEAPNTLQARTGLSNILTREGHYEEAEKLLSETLGIERRLFGPDNPRTVKSVYNMACLEAQMGKREEAFKFLNESVEHGMTPRRAQHLESDTDLKSLHGDPRFAAFVARAKDHAASTRSAK
jgi:serine/threonine protein kinase/tetratricopeptide (TPR) repeat protein